MPPFLEAFKGTAEPAPLVRDVTIQSAVGPVRGFLARPATKEPLPALLLLHDEAGLGAWMKQSARDLCGIGYVVLALDLEQSRQRNIGKPQGPGAALGDERTLAEMSAAVRWLRRRADVLPDRIGVAGWSWGAGQALALAASTPVQACVVCDGPVGSEPALIAGLRGTAVLGLFAGKDEQTRRTLPAFRKALAAAGILHQLHIYEGVEKGFMSPARGTAPEHAVDQAWVEIYEFLGKHVEDAPGTAPSVRQPRRSR